MSTMKQTKAVYAVWVLGAIALGLGTTAVVSRAGATSGTSSRSAAAPISSSVLTPATAIPAIRTAPITSVVGVLLPPQMANVSSRGDGRLVEVPVKVGQTVKKGDVLAVFDSRERKAELAMAEAQLKSAQGAAAAAGADLASARSRAARRNTTVDVGGRSIALVSGEESSQSVFEAHGAAGRAAHAAGQVGEQRARIDALRIALEETELRASFDGVVTGVYFESGMNVHAKETVVRVVGGGRGLRVRLGVPEEGSTRLASATTAQLALDDGRILGARIARVSPEVDPASRTFVVEGDVDFTGDERESAMLAGRTVHATLSGP